MKILRLKPNVTEDDLLKKGFIIDNTTAGLVAYRERKKNDTHGVFILLTPPQRVLRWRFASMFSELLENEVQDALDLFDIEEKEDE